MKKFCKEPCKILNFAWKLSLNEGDHAIKIDGGRQKDRRTDRVYYRGTSLLKILQKWTYK